MMEAASSNKRVEMRSGPHALEISKCMTTWYTSFGSIDIVLSEEEILLVGSADCREVMSEVSSRVKRRKSDY